MRTPLTNRNWLARARDLRVVWIALLIGFSGCMVRSEREMCYADIQYGEKSNDVKDPCIGLGFFGHLQSPEGAAVRDYYLLLCVASMLEAQKCEGKSNWIPKVDARM